MAASVTCIPSGVGAVMCLRRFWGSVLDDQQALGSEQFDLAADAGFSLAEIVGNGLLLDARIPFQHHQDFVLAEADAELLLQDLVGLLAHDAARWCTR